MNCTEHHHCTPSCLYGGRNPIVTNFIADPDPQAAYRGYLCCVCHNLIIVGPSDPPPAVPGKTCLDCWKEYDKAVDSYIAQHGPLGG